MGYRMNGFSGFGNSPAKQQDPLEKKIVSQEVDTHKKENKLDGDKTSSKEDIIKSPDKDKTSPTKHPWPGADPSKVHGHEALPNAFKGKKKKKK